MLVAGMHYAGARYYMSALGRFGVSDPMSERYPGWSPYHYAANRPTSVYDPTGKFWVSIHDGDVIAHRLGQYAGGMWSLFDFGIRSVKGGGLVGMGSLAARDAVIDGYTKMSTQEPRGIDYALAAADLATSIGRMTGSGLRESATGIANASRFTNWAVRFLGVGDLVVDDIAFGALNEVNPTIEGEKLLRGKVQGATRLTLNPSLAEAWGGNAPQEFASQIDYAKQVTRSLLDEGYGMSGAEAELTRHLRAREEATSVSDDSGMCQFAMQWIDGLTQEGCAGM